MHPIHLGWIPQTIYTGAELGNDSVETLIMKIVQLETLLGGGTAHPSFTSMVLNK